VALPSEAPSWGADLELARRCTAGDRGAQRELYEREKRRVHARLYRVFGSNRHIEDVIQESFLQVFRSLGSFRGESSLATWIDRCAVRAAFAYLAKGKKRGAELELVPDLPSNDPSAERIALARDATRRLYAVLDRLDPRQRLAFVLHEIEGHSLAEVAELTESNVIATKARLFRARQRVHGAAADDAVLKGFLKGDDA
jgi:RNA polymerase sigma-70 factor (ECF subfamily)